MSGASADQLTRLTDNDKAELEFDLISLILAISMLAVINLWSFGGYYDGGGPASLIDYIWANSLFKASYLLNPPGLSSSLNENLSRSEPDV